MKTIHVVLIAVATALFSGGIGFVGGTAIGGIGGAAAGVLLGICITAETAQQEGILTPEQADSLVGTMRQNAATQWDIPPEDLEQLNCDRITQDLRSE
ncbi:MULTISPECIES: hypothetical protein [Arthrospira]|uniref:Glycine zipper domain-containing protein n=1 Tax=Limnospira platensis NIES-46 TaxID=1236695 RepID=A0A5M3T5K9_LIMPL|nr:MULTISPECIES: hypothetical protein [Arthrospira]AMW29314.1 hypothetical protein AP285_16475 [Arthrospira platensis YZ]KDR58624.1 hypothetical protein APPUASWS_004100 [Arthrospira platensis str. Paraca]MBD2668868.1 hypothetical protein [Arthrospira platensis FACHB-439]MBD2709602.1 hypothetical protein [Arthrospira platensis FACHB-835]MDF2213208.1 hypothetical protein [Arthrospira platensis NCB002]MDT9183025.1 hypothetical protein [Limnospira sp. PMC 289.06]MDT9294351.1 hypothetical protein